MDVPFHFKFIFKFFKAKPNTECIFLTSRYSAYKYSRQNLINKDISGNQKHCDELAHRCHTQKGNMVGQIGCMNNFKSLLSFFNDVNVKLVADSYRENRAIQRNRETTSRIADVRLNEGLNLFICVLENREFLCSRHSKH